MIAANEDYNPYVADLMQMDPAQLRQILATAGGLLAHKSSPMEARTALYNIGDKLWAKPTIKALALEFCAREGVTLEELTGIERDRNAAWPRQHFMYLCVVEYEKSHAAVGRFLNRDHTSVIHGVKSHKRRAGL